MDSHIGGPAITLHGPLKQEHRSMLTLFEYYIALDIACFFLSCRLLPDTKGIFGEKKKLIKSFFWFSNICYISFLPFFLTTTYVLIQLISLSILRILNYYTVAFHGKKSWSCTLQLGHHMHIHLHLFILQHSLPYMFVF